MKELKVHNNYNYLLNFILERTTNIKIYNQLYKQTHDYNKKKQGNNPNETFDNNNNNTIYNKVEGYRDFIKKVSPERKYEDTENDNDYDRVVQGTHSTILRKEKEEPYHSNTAREPTQFDGRYNKMNETFNQEVGDYKYIRSEIEIIKKNIDDNQKVALIFKEDTNSSIGTLNYKFEIFNKDFSLIRDSYMVNIIIN